MNSNLNTLRDYLRIVFRHKTVIITTFITVMISVVIGLELKTPFYEAQVKMLISAQKQIESPYYRVLTGYERSGISLTQSEIVNSNPVIERAVKALKLHERPPDYEKNYCSPLKSLLLDIKLKMSQSRNDSSESATQYYQDLDDNQQIGISLTKDEISNPDSGHEQTQAFRWAVEGLKKSISVDPIRDTDLFTITAYDFNPEAAALIANVVSRSYVIFDLEQQLAELQLKYGEKQPIVVQLKDNIERMTKNLTGVTLPDIEAIGPASVKIIEQALTPLTPTGTKKKLSLVLAFFMSIFLGIMLSFGLEYIDHTFKSPQDVEAFLNLPLLGSIPKKEFKDKTLIKNAKQTNDFHNPYQTLSDQIYLLMKDKNFKSMLITAASHSEGSSTITANLANYLSNNSGHKVIIIDANLRTPSIHKVFNIPESPGLANVLEGKTPLEKAAHNMGTNLTVLPAGTTSLNPTPLLDSHSMFNIIKTAKENYELIFVDYANLMSFRDACILSSYLDGVALVVNEGKTRRHVMKSLLSPLKHKKANLIGVILNNRTFAIPRVIYDRL